VDGNIPKILAGISKEESQPQKGQNGTWREFAVPVPLSPQRETLKNSNGMMFPVG